MNQDLQFRPATNADIPAVKEIVSSVLAEYDIAAPRESTNADLDDIEANYAQAGGVFEVVTTADGRIVGCIGLRPVDSRRAELRTMYLRREVRRQGLGRQLLQRMLTEACQREFQEVWLKANPGFWTAIRLFKECGFTSVKNADTVSRGDRLYYLPLSGAAPIVWRADWQPMDYGMPRRFGIGHLLLITVVYAVLFGVLRAMRVSTFTFLATVGTFTMVGAGQAVLFQGKQPYRASLVSGIAAFYLLIAITAIRASMISGLRFDFLDLFASLFCAGIAGTILGSVFGYATGMLLGGVFRSWDSITSFVRRKPRMPGPIPQPLPPPSLSQAGEGRIVESPSTNG